MAVEREVFAPDGRAWRVMRMPCGDTLTTRMFRREGWQVRAVTAGPPEDRREWRVGTRSEASALVDEVAMALRTGAEGPPEPRQSASR